MRISVNPSISSIRKKEKRSGKFPTFIDDYFTFLGSIISVVGRTTIGIMEPILL